VSGSVQVRQVGISPTSSLLHVVGACGVKPADEPELLESGYYLSEVRVKNGTATFYYVPSGLKPVWCVKHREGWCATKGGRRPDPKALSDATRCGSQVIARWGGEKRIPDCEECLKLMRKRSRQKR